MGNAKDNMVIISDKPWNRNLAEDLNYGFSDKQFVLLDTLDIATVKAMKPRYIFVPHYSKMIPKEIYENYETIIFHTGPHPGGSPIQNLILDGYETTEINAIECTDIVDGGRIYNSRSVDLIGTAEEIFIKINNIIGIMLFDIVKFEIKPKEKYLNRERIYKRRKPEDGHMNDLPSLYRAYDYIRMLTAQGYPPAFIETKNIKFEFTNPLLKVDGIECLCKITRR